jgi:hypothetical protein
MDDLPAAAAFEIVKGGRSVEQTPSFFTSFSLSPPLLLLVDP